MDQHQARVSKRHVERPFHDLYTACDHSNLSDDALSMGNDLINPQVDTKERATNVLYQVLE
jgi:hypothetical protein